MMPHIESLAQRDALIANLKTRIAFHEELAMSGSVNENQERTLLYYRITLAALEADTSKLAELAGKVRKVREDAKDFDGDRRGMWEYQENQEALLLEEAVKYTAPVPVLKPVVCPYLEWDCDRTEAHFKYQEAIREAGYPIEGDNHA